jgi:CHAP domain
MARCDTYAFGNCTRGACELAPWLPEYLGDGGDWAMDYVRAGGMVTMTPTVGSVVCYCRGDGYSEFGHCGIVLQVYSNGTFLVREMNFSAFNTYDDRVSTMGDVCGFLLPPGVQPGQGAGVTAGGDGGDGLSAAMVAWGNWADWLNNGAEHWVQELNTASNLMSQL